MLPLGPARLLYRPTVGGHKDYDRLYPLFPFPWAFITAGRLPASRWLWAPLLPPPELCLTSPNPRAGCLHVRVCVSLVLGPSPVIQAGPPAMLSHDLIRRRGAAGRHRHQALPGSCHPSPARLDPVSGGETGWGTRQPQTEVTLPHYTQHHTQSWPEAGHWGDSENRAPIPP